MSVTIHRFEKLQLGTMVWVTLTTTGSRVWTAGEVVDSQEAPLVYRVRVIQGPHAGYDVWVNPWCLRTDEQHAKCLLLQ